MKCLFVGGTNDGRYVEFNDKELPSALQLIAEEGDRTHNYCIKETPPMATCVRSEIYRRHEFCSHNSTPNITDTYYIYAHDGMSSSCIMYNLIKHYKGGNHG